MVKSFRVGRRKIFPLISMVPIFLPIQNMPGLYQTLLNRLTSLAGQYIYTDVNPDHQRRRTFLLLFVLVSTIIAAISMVIGFQSSGVNSVEVIMPFSAVVVGIGCLVGLRYWQQVDLLFAAATIFYGFAMLYVLLIGTAQGSTYIWFYVYPLIAYFLMGKLRGGIMVLLSWVASTLIILFNLGYHLLSILRARPICHELFLGLHPRIYHGSITRLLL